MKPLTAVETEVMFLLCLGHSNKEVAQMMGSSIKTVEKHRQSVYYKWHVDSITAMIRVALREKHMAVDFFLASVIGENCHHEVPQNQERVLA
jgi:DNA-binding NarL/FixJ family response regulator